MGFFAMIFLSLIFDMMVEVSIGHNLSLISYLGKILIHRLRDAKCKRSRFLQIFSETTFCTMVEGNWGFHLNVILYQ